MPWQVQSNPTGNPLPLGRVHATARKTCMLQRKNFFEAFKPGLNAGGPVQLPFRITFGLCQVIYVLAVYKNIFCVSLDLIVLLHGYIHNST